MCLWEVECHMFYYIYVVLQEMIKELYILMDE